MIWDEEMADFQDTKHYHAVSRTPEISGEARLDIFVEPHLIEIFVNDGWYVLSNVVYPEIENAEGKQLFEVQSLQKVREMTQKRVDK